MGDVKNGTQGEDGRCNYNLSSIAASWTEIFTNIINVKVSLSVCWFETDLNFEDLVYCDI